MNDHLRITNGWPSPSLLEEFPNWENALGEESADGQDEATLRPSEDQSLIGEYVPFTAATAWLNNGQECSAIIEIVDEVAGINLYLRGQWYRLLRYVNGYGQFEHWVPHIENWLPEEKQAPSVSLSDKEIFPLRFASRLPYYKTLSTIRTQIMADGSENTWEE